MSKNVKSIEVKPNKLNKYVSKTNFNKTNFILSFLAYKFLDTNSEGYVFLEEQERDLYQKWEFIKASDKGFYNIRNCLTLKYLTSNENSEIFVCDENTSLYSMWAIYETSEKEMYIIVNNNNSLLQLNITDTLYLNENLDFKRIDKKALFKIFPKIIVK